MPRRRRSWNAARQLASERPPDPLVAGCETCGKRRTCILVNLQPVCLRCAGCPWCGQKNPIVEEYADDELMKDPVHLGSQIIRGDWQCLACARTLVDWSSWRRRMRGWQKGRRAMAETRHQKRRAA